MEAKVVNVLARARWFRVLGAAAAVLVLSFLVLMGIVAAYAFVLAFQARGVPDQTAINHFAATISPRMMPWLEALLTFLMAWRVNRVTDASKADGVFVGVLSGLLSTTIVLAFGGPFNLGRLVVFLALTALGWLGGLAGQRWGAQR
jgi:hypothetical protein